MDVLTWEWTDWQDLNNCVLLEAHDCAGQIANLEVELENMKDAAMRDGLICSRHIEGG